ncbi:MAG TPA: 16S rRNA (adenine(1518)-N(6)/adenine(1519)-N(6))-dimethyltransferase RsmA, partial [Candidatus Dormibacteraeota bacterium]|nr:16S rRNA (adenine(1518)-N(6)/adenine(1519)-N(6))-dimethyltransferase RsmA [Candidatus Dormibacteraeota bacterium]
PPGRGRLRADKRLGQHWLVDPALRERVVAAAGIGPGDEVLEIGAGPGTITGELAGTARRVVAVELDARVLPRLRAAAPGAEVLHADIMKVDPAVLFPQGGEIVVGNIPYYLTGALVPHLLGREPRPRRLSLVVQREVARRWCGLDGWSLATVAVQTFSEPRIAFELPAEAFDPPPKVTSALAILEVRPEPAVSVPDLDAFFRFAEAVFQFRRKQLRPALARVAGLGGDEAAARLHDLGIDPSRRAETLTLAEWERAYRAFTGLS